MRRPLATAALLALISTCLAGAAQAAGAAQTWEIDPVHSAAHFSVRHMMISHVRGDFSKVTGTVTWDGKDVTTAQIDATIDTTTVNTREPKRDADLKSENFLEVAKYPTMTFKSKKVARVGDRLRITGDLTLHGVTRAVVLDAEVSPPTKDPWGNTRIGASATTKINRKDFGLKWNKALESGGVVVGDELDITLDVEMVKQG